MANMTFVIFFVLDICNISRLEWSCFRKKGEMKEIEELQRISEMNDNEVVVNLPQGKFNITFTKVD